MVQYICCEIVLISNKNFKWWYIERRLLNLYLFFPNYNLFNILLILFFSSISITALCYTTGLSKFHFHKSKQCRTKYEATNNCQSAFTYIIFRHNGQIAIVRPYFPERHTRYVYFSLHTSPSLKYTEIALQNLNFKLKLYFWPTN